MRTMTTPRPKSADAHSPPATPEAETQPTTSTSTSHPTPDLHTLTPTALDTSNTDLLVENGVLRGKITELQQEMEAVLNHSIESDQRLLQYTKEIFPQTPSGSPDLLTSSDQEDHQAVVNKNRQLEETLFNVREEIENLKEELLSANKTKEKFKILQEETKHMIDTIRCLEADNKELKNSAFITNKKHEEEIEDMNNEVIILQETVKDLRKELCKAHKTDKTDFQNLLEYHRVYPKDNFRCLAQRLQEEVTSRNKQIKELTKEISSLKSSLRRASSEVCRREYPSSPPSLPSHCAMVPIRNSFDGLTQDEDDSAGDETPYTTVTRNRRKNKKKKEARNKNKIKYRKVPVNDQRRVRLKFKHVTILGDSHIRHLAGKMLKIVESGTVITATCKPGAGLMQIAPVTTTPPPDHCFILVAGTNDMAAGRQDIILSKIEKVIQDLTKLSKVLLSPLPHRHDLPAGDPLHRSTNLVNEYLAELCIRYKGVELLDLSGIGRQHFTNHGLHMRDSGKSLLADVVVKALSSMNPLPSHTLAELRSTTDTSASASPAQSPPRQGPTTQLADSDRRQPTPAVNSSPSSPIILAHDSFAEAVRVGPVSPKVCEVPAGACVHVSSVLSPSQRSESNQPEVSKILPQSQEVLFLEMSL